MGAVIPGEDAGLAASSSRAARSVAPATTLRTHHAGRSYVYPLTAAGWAVGAVVTLLILYSPVVVPAFRQPRLHLVLDTVDACVALLAAYMAHQRFRRGRQRQNLYLSQGLAALVVAAVGPRWLSAALDLQGQPFDVWLRLTCQLVATALIVGAAIVGIGDRSRTVGRRRFAWSWTAVALVLLAAAGVVWLLRPVLPDAVAGGYTPADVDLASLDTHPVLLAGQAVAWLALLTASVAFARQARRRPDSFIIWLAPACALAGFARLNYALHPSIYSDWIYTGDFLRTAFYVLLLIGATREIREYWGSRAYEAVLEDRRRLARELHDGVIQELAYIRAEAHGLDSGEGSGARIISASDRALDEARSALAALEATGDGSLGLGLLVAAREASRRHGVELEIDLDDTIAADSGQRHALARILREAIANAARHGGARRVTVRLMSDGDRRSLRIADDGRGFDVAAEEESGHGYGLTSMRERARALPGELRITSQPGSGSVVTVTW
ncbi:ATP-binding protein [Naasia sp. SYSU D00057]|uniref:ATP-binding protein n=1 Tax=Naasia sp. SYSU D00057 TaxID=2817380 RepID=UPI001B305038|nr:ATP-binding protein [Naasia sp. SYSU D00057]